jgi:carbamoyl-phosphate synthase large subunit
MPKRQDLKTILIIGSGPIVIGQACEFDYSGTQACQAIREEGYRVVLVNSNPATIMTDPNIADATYIEPIHWKVLEKIISKEKPDAILPTMGGQTALNCALDLERHGILKKYNVELIGAKREAIDKAEDRALFAKCMRKLGLAMPKSGLAHSMEEAWAVVERLGYPTIIRPSFTMGGSGGGVAYNQEEFKEICERGLALSPTRELLIDESIIGWKEYELEVVRDRADNCIIVCSIENLDPMGIHTGDSITVAPAQTLTDKEYQRMRQAAFDIIREIGVETGGANVQFAVNPRDGQLVVIEMNPRVSRSSALASKATGFPIAKIAAKLAVGYTLDELKNDMTDGKTPASFEPTLDYVVTKIPRFNFEKFPDALDRLTTQMKSVGEVMGIGGSFCESFQKALCGLETDCNGLNTMIDWNDNDMDARLSTIEEACRFAGSKRIFYVADAFRAGFSLEDVHQMTHIDPWFLSQIEHLIQVEEVLKKTPFSQVRKEDLYDLKRLGFSDSRLADLLDIPVDIIAQSREQWHIHPGFRRVDSCAAEFDTSANFYYSTYFAAPEKPKQKSQRKKVVVLGSGPNRIGQGIEFDYCCVQAVLGLQEMNVETVMINCNPETVSTDHDLPDALYFESLTFEHVCEVVRVENPDGVVVQFGGQTPLKLADALEKVGIPIIGTPPSAIRLAEDREQFANLIRTLNLKQPANGTVRSVDEGLRLAHVLAYPLIVRPSFVLGGRAMAVIYNQDQLKHYLKSCPVISAQSPLLLDQFLDQAIEVDVDALCDGEEVMIGGILEHIEQAGVHSGDSCCVLPPHSLSESIQNTIKDNMVKLAKALGVVGLMNAQFAVKNDEVYIIEVNPRASRTVPFIAKAIHLPLAKIAVKTMMGIALKDQTIASVKHGYSAVKLPVFPFAKFPTVDPNLGPEMRSTGEAMGIAPSFGHAFAKALLSGGHKIPEKGSVFISVKEADKAGSIAIARHLSDRGFYMYATAGTARVLQNAKIPCDIVKKVREGRPNIVDMIKNDEIDLIINTTDGQKTVSDSCSIRRNAIMHAIAYTTTLAGAQAICEAMDHRPDESVISLQELHGLMD